MALTYNKRRNTEGRTDSNDSEDQGNNMFRLGAICPYGPIAVRMHPIDPTVMRVTAV